MDNHVAPMSAKVQVWNTTFNEIEVFAQTGQAGILTGSKTHPVLSDIMKPFNKTTSTFGIAYAYVTV